MSFDELLARPMRELVRMAVFLGIPDPSASRVCKEYVGRFVCRDLCHHSSTQEDLRLRCDQDSSVPALYDKLNKYAAAYRIPVAQVKQLPCCRDDTANEALLVKAGSAQARRINDLQSDLRKMELEVEPYKQEAIRYRQLHSGLLHRMADWLIARAGGSQRRYDLVMRCTSPLRWGLRKLMGADSETVNRQPKGSQ